MAIKRQARSTVTAATAPPAATPPTPSVLAAFVAYLKKGCANAEYRTFEAKLGQRRGWGCPASVWDLVDDSVDGSGGFATGRYLFPFPAELQGEVARPDLVQGGASTPSIKYMDRQRMADYDNFSAHICRAGWNRIVASSELISRSSDDARVNDWWSDVDGEGTAILDFLEYPREQARRFGVGWIFVDRPAGELASVADNADPANEPYAYAVPTRNVRDWKRDRDGKFTLVIRVEPDPDCLDPNVPPPVRVWTTDGWAVFATSKGTATAPAAIEEWTVTDSGPWTLGRVPAVLIHNERPKPGKIGLGSTDMLEVARKSQTVYNIDSEAREIERNCASPIFVIPVKNLSEYTSSDVVVGSTTALLYDGEGASPDWITPPVEILEKLDARKQRLIDRSYEAADLRALVGNVQTSSGFHAEVEFSKTELRIAREAMALEAAEKWLVIVYLLFLDGMAVEESSKDVATVTYPRQFGVRDVDKAQERLDSRLASGLGPDADREALQEYFQTSYPRAGVDKVKAMAEAALKFRDRAAQASDRLRKMVTSAASVTGANSADGGDAAVKSQIKANVRNAPGEAADAAAGNEG